MQLWRVILVQSLCYPASVHIGKGEADFDGIGKDILGAVPFSWDIFAELSVNMPQSHSPLWIAKEKLSVWSRGLLWRTVSQMFLNSKMSTYG